MTDIIKSRAAPEVAFALINFGKQTGKQILMTGDDVDQRVGQIIAAAAQIT